MISTPSTISLSTIFEKESTIGHNLTAKIQPKLTMDQAHKASASVSRSFDNWDLLPQTWGGQGENLSSDFEWFEEGLENASILSLDESSNVELGKRAFEDLDTEASSVATSMKKICKKSGLASRKSESGNSTPTFELTDLED